MDHKRSETEVRDALNFKPVSNLVCSFVEYFPANAPIYLKLFNTALKQINKISPVPLCPSTGIKDRFVAFLLRVKNACEPR